MILDWDILCHPSLIQCVCAAQHLILGGVVHGFSVSVGVAVMDACRKVVFGDKYQGLRGHLADKLHQ